MSPWSYAQLAAQLDHREHRRRAQRPYRLRNLVGATAANEPFKILGSLVKIAIICQLKGRLAEPSCAANDLDDLRLKLKL